jgi:hypothetical protein
MCGSVKARLRMARVRRALTAKRAAVQRQSSRVIVTLYGILRRKLAAFGRLLPQYHLDS